jgi:hypothetical protein
MGGPESGSGVQAAERRSPDCAKDFRWRVHYTIGGGGHDAIVPAESSAQARREVMSMFPGAVVTGPEPDQIATLQVALNLLAGPSVT